MELIQDLKFRKLRRGTFELYSFSWEDCNSPAEVSSYSYGVKGNNNKLKGNNNKLLSKDTQLLGVLAQKFSLSHGSGKKELIILLKKSIYLFKHPHWGFSATM